MITALLIDDEEKNLDNLSFLLENDCDGIKVIGKVQSAAKAREWLSQNKVDVIFLDITMPLENGFQFLESLAVKNFQIIFVTAYNEFALQAIKASALDYILKPINIDDLKNAVEKLKRTQNDFLSHSIQQELINNLFDSVNKKSLPQKIALPQLGGIQFIEVDEIVSLQADSNYTIIHKTNMQKLVITKILKDFEELLDANQFVRIHKSYIVSLKYIKEYSKTDGGIVKMTDGNQWSISRRQLDLFLSKMKSNSLMFGK